MNAYILLRAALALFKKTPAELTSQQLAQAQTQARNEYLLEQKVLSSPQALLVIIPASEVDHAYHEIKSRYVDEATFLAALTANHLTVDSLRDALYRQVKVNTVLECVAVNSGQVSDTEVELFYQANLPKFSRPEQREVCHILISINPQYPENDRANALKRMQQIQILLQQDVAQFAALALKHSECPTALQGGTLGTVERGKLYPALDAALFSLNADELSEIVESEMGFHILHCKQIHPADTLSLEQARTKIRELLQGRFQRQQQRQWLASLPAL